MPADAHESGWLDCLARARYCLIDRFVEPLDGPVDPAAPHEKILPGKTLYLTGLRGYWSRPWLASSLPYNMTAARDEPLVTKEVIT
jgi:hypothetical protein